MAIKLWLSNYEKQYFAIEKNVFSLDRNFSELEWIPISFMDLTDLVSNKKLPKFTLWISLHQIEFKLLAVNLKVMITHLRRLAFGLHHHLLAVMVGVIQRFRQLSEILQLSANIENYIAKFSVCLKSYILCRPNSLTLY